MTSFQAARASAQSDIDEAQNGTDGAPSLSALRTQAGQATKALAPAQETVGRYRDFLAANPNVNLTLDQSDAFFAANKLVSEHTSALNAAQAQINRRQAVIDDARQRHDQASAGATSAYQLASQAGTKRVRAETMADLASYANGTDLPDARMSRYQRMGLLDENGLTDVGASLLPRPQAQTQPRQVWQSDQQAILAANPRIGVPGTAENAAFVQAFRANRGDARAALSAVRGR